MKKITVNTVSAFSADVIADMLLAGHKVQIVIKTASKGTKNV